MMLVYMILAFCTLDGLYSEAAVHQPYKDPNFQPMENMIAALRGYNVRAGDPLGEKGDPGFVGQLFQATKYDENNRIVALGEFTTTDRGACTNSIQDKKFTTTEQYREYLEESTSSGVNLQVGNEIDVSIDADVKGIGVGASTTIPPPFTRSWGRSKNSKNSEQFFSMKHGLMTMATATCIVYDITFGAQLPPFTDHFKKALELLVEATSLPEDQQKKQFITFIEEYGTHYLKNVKMGAQFTQITEYSKELRKNISDSDLEECNHKTGAKILGIQVEEDSSKCTKTVEQQIENSNKEDMKRHYLTKGSTSLKIGNFIDNVVPVPIDFELSPIANLFTNTIFKSQGITVGGKEVTSTQPLLNWFLPMYKNICIVMGGTNQSCYETPRGCGFNDKCPSDTLCLTEEPGDYNCTEWTDWTCFGDSGCEERRTRKCFGCEGETVQTRKNCTAGHRCLYEPIVWVAADGTRGRTEVDMGKARHQSDCSRKCLERRARDNITNGATYNPANKNCWCEIEQTGLKISKTYRNMWFDESLPIPPMIECEPNEAGEGDSDDEYYIGKYPNINLCSMECDKLRRADGQINGMTYEPKKEYCWCQKNMDGIDYDSKYKSCYFRLKKKEKVECIYVPADGKGGSEINIGTVPNSEACVAECEERRDTQPTINGASYSLESKKCYCERGQRSQSISSTWKNCWFGKKYYDPPSECPFLSGDARGGRSIYIGKQSTAEKCAINCYRLKSIDAKINGATFRDNNRDCYCEHLMSWRSPRQGYRSCQFHRPVAKYREFDPFKFLKDFFG